MGEVLEGEHHVLRGWMKRTAGTGSLTIKVYFSNGSNPTLYGSHVKAFAGSDWEYFVVPILVPKGFKVIRQLDFEPEAATTILLDDLEIPV